MVNRSKYVKLPSKKKYNQEFVVEESSLSAAGLGVEGTWVQTLIL